MAKRKSLVKCLLISSQKGLDLLQPVLKDVVSDLKAEIHIDVYTQMDRNVIVHSTRQREKDFVEFITSSDIILVDLTRTSPLSFFELGVARAIGKPMIFISEDGFIEELPDLIKQSYFILYRKKEELQKGLDSFFKEYLENPKRFTPRSLVEQDTSSQIVIDLERLAQREFENLCFELLSRLGYKQLEWKIKDDFIDAVSTLRKKDPDGFEYEEYWLISFGKEYKDHEMLQMAIHDPEFFTERIFRNIFDQGMFSGAKLIQEKSDVPITLMFIFRGKEKFSKKFIHELSRKEYRHRGRISIRIRWWDDQTITTLVQNNLQLSRKYFSSDASTTSIGIRLSYEELYKQNAVMYDELQKANDELISQRSRAESLERDAAWKLLSFTAAHRLGNPVDAIQSELSNLKVALNSKKTEVVGEIIDSMELSVEKAKSIIYQFRNLSIAHEIKPSVIGTDKLNEILKRSAKQAIDKKVQVEFDLKKLPDVSLDIQKMSECFEELIKNSLNFIKGANQKISISTALVKNIELPDKIDRTKEYIKITFADNGCGVPYEKKNEIFKPFERSYIHGTGLGLSFCEIIIEKHAGKIREIGKPNDGASFEIFLPVTQNKGIKK